MITWIEAPDYLRLITGLRRTAKVGATEYGVFREKYGADKWTLRRRPLDGHGQPADSWGYPLMGAATLRALEAYYARCVL